MMKFILALFALSFVFSAIGGAHRLVVENLYTVIGTLTLFTVAILAGVHQIKKERDELRKLEEMLVKKIIKSTRSDFVAGYRILEELGWINVTGCNSTNDVEEKLKIQAAKLGANGLIKSHWKPVSESSIKGYGRRGNPYYERSQSYDGEGVAVKIEKLSENYQSATTGVATKSAKQSNRINSGWVAIDGNNLFCLVFDQTKDIDSTFRVFRKFLSNLDQSPYKFHVFWDSSFIRFLHAIDKSTTNNRLDKILSSNLKIHSQQLTISNRNQSADELIIPWSKMKSAAIVSNDEFNKQYEDELIIEAAQQLKLQDKLVKAHFIAGEIVTPRLTAI